MESGFSGAGESGLADNAGVRGSRRGVAGKLENFAGKAPRSVPSSLPLASSLDKLALRAVFFMSWLKPRPTNICAARGMAVRRVCGRSVGLDVVQRTLCKLRKGMRHPQNLKADARSRCQGRPAAVNSSASRSGSLGWPPQPAKTSLEQGQEIIRNGV